MLCSLTSHAQLSKADSLALYQSIQAAREKYNEAIVCFDKAIALSPNNANAHYTKGLALIEMKMYNEFNEKCK